MGKHHNPYAPEFRAQMVELVKAGRSPEELAREFEPTVWRDNLDERRATNKMRMSRRG
ncbi:hypothetical protein GWC77_28895 [Paraburkholderia sp. NMBU_R16]|nr:hypothetical protein [Paraburkholderia sp. NMBU_R16]